jgi:hypothetical protein
VDHHFHDLPVNPRDSYELSVARFGTGSRNLFTSFIPALKPSHGRDMMRLNSPVCAVVRIRPGLLGRLRLLRHPARPSTTASHREAQQTFLPRWCQLGPAGLLEFQEAIVNQVKALIMVGRPRVSTSPELPLIAQQQKMTSLKIRSTPLLAQAFRSTDTGSRARYRGAREFAGDAAGAP